MKTKQVKINQSYLLDDKEVVTVIKRIPGKIKSRCMHTSILFNGYNRMQSNFLLSNKKIVKANRLNQINN